MKIRTAVFPVAGRGTRFLPATKASPKEMLPIVDKPLIQYAVEEAAAAGITEMIFITGRNKRAIEDHFDTAYELENELEQAQKHALLELVRNVIPKNVNCIYIRQPAALGLGHAVLCARPVVGNDPFAVLLQEPRDAVRRTRRVAAEPDHGPRLTLLEHEADGVLVEPGGACRSHGHTVSTTRSAKRHRRSGVRPPAPVRPAAQP